MISTELEPEKESKTQPPNTEFTQTHSSSNDSNHENSFSLNDSSSQDEDKISPNEVDADYGPLNYHDYTNLNTRSILWDIIKQLTSGADLTRVTLPTFVLEPRSTLERFTDFYSHPDLLLHMHEIEDPLQRFMDLVKFYLSCWHTRPDVPVKPYNALLGERFYCHWNHGDSRTEYLGEQVSHHPPISAVYMENRKKQYVLSTVVHTLSKFWGNSAGSVPVGHTDFYLLNHKEHYVWTYPTVMVLGLLVGTLRTELSGETYLENQQNGLRADFNFLLKPFIGGDYCSVTGTVTDLNAKKTLYTLSGKFDDIIYITDEQDITTPLWVCNDCPVTQKTVERVSEQGPWESRKVWEQLTLSLKRNDHISATKNKTNLEQYQRSRASDRQENNLEYHPTFWTFNEKNNCFTFKHHNFDPGLSERSLRSLDDTNPTLSLPLSPEAILTDKK